MKLKILGKRRYVRIISSVEMLEKFGEVPACKQKDGVLYINEDVSNENVKKFGKHLTLGEIVEDIYTRIRRDEIKRYEKLTYWDVISDRRLKN